MVLDATTVANVKGIIKVPSGDASLDTILGDMISAVSLRAENYIGRSFEQAERTETYDIGWRTQAIFLTHTPIDTGETFEVRNDFSRAFTGTALSSSLYDLDPNTGRLYFLGALVAGPNVLQVIYTGGLAADAAALQAIEDLEFAIRRQVAHEYNRRNAPAAKKPTPQRGQVQRAGEGEVDWLKSTRDVLDSYRNRWISTGGLI